jgi:hypothetical protein
MMESWLLNSWRTSESTSKLPYEDAKRVVSRIFLLCFLSFSNRPCRKATTDGPATEATDVDGGQDPTSLDEPVATTQQAATSSTDPFSDSPSPTSSEGGEQTQATSSEEPVTSTSDDPLTTSTTFTTSSSPQQTSTTSHEPTDSDPTTSRCV